MPSRFDALFNTVINDHTIARPNRVATNDQAYEAAAARAEGTGSSIKDPVTRDMIDLNDDEILAKYGPQQGLDLIAQRTRGAGQFRRDRTQGGSGGTFDTLTGVGLGLAGSLGGMAALGVGAINDRAGSAIAQAVTAGSEWVRENQSDQLNVRRRAYEAGRRIENADSEEQYQRDLKDGTALAGLRRIGRDIGNSVSRMGSDGAILGDTVTEGVGSLLVGGPVAKGLAKVGNAVLKGARITTEGAMPAAIAAMEAGGSYQQTVSEIEDMSHYQLMASSPDYRELIADGWTPEAARTEIATSAGLAAAAITAPAAAVSGKLVSKFEASPLRAGSLGSAAGNILRETVEEGAQSGAGQFAQNVGTKAFADANRSLTDGVGEQIGIGGIVGMGTAGVLQAPAIAGNAVAEAVGRPAFAAADAVYKAGTAVVGAARSRIASIAEAARAASPVSTENLNTEAEDAIANGDIAREAVNQEVEAGTLTPEQAQVVSERMAKLDETIRFNPEELTGRGLSPEVEAHIGQATNRFDALSKAAELAGSTEVSPEQRIEAATFVNDMFSQHGNAMIDDVVSALEPLPDDHEITRQLQRYENVLLNMKENPEVQKALQVAQTIASKVRAKDIDDTQIETPRGLQMAKAVVSVAQTDPAKIDGETATTILAHARKGKITLSAVQSRLLSGISAIRKVAGRYEVQSKAAKQKPIDIVANEILDRDSGEETPYKSMAEHLREIHQSMAANDMAGAAQSLERMLAFAKHMQNKVQALNESLAEGSGRQENGIKYQVLTPTGRFRPSLKGMWINPEVPASIDLAQKINLEAEAIGNMANEMALLYPELGANPVPLVPLDASLTAGTPTQVAKTYRAARAAGQKTPAAAAPSPTPTPAPTPAPQPVTEPAKVTPEAEAQPSTPAETGSTVTETAAEETPKPKTVLKAGPKFESAPETAPEADQAQPAEESLPAANSTTAAEPDTVNEKPEPTQEGQAPETGNGNDDVPADELGGPATDDSPSETDDASSGRSLAETYPALLGQDGGPVKNKFVEAFKLRKQPKTRLALGSSPLETVRDAVKSDDSLTEFRGKQARRVLTGEIAKAYDALFGKADQVAQQMEKRLATFLGTPTSKKNGAPRFGDWLINGTGTDTQANELPRGRALNIVEKFDDEGGISFGYNQFLGEAAILAGLNWVLANNQTSRTYNAEDIARILGINEDDVTDTDVFVFNSSHWHTGAVRAIAGKIVEYWGVSENHDIPEAIVKGIPEAVAIEVLEGMAAAGLITIAPYEIMGKPSMFIGVNPMAEDMAKVKQFPSLIETALQIEPDEVYHVGEPPKNVAKSQLHGSPAALLKQQQDAIKVAQDTPYRVNPVMWTMVQQLGLEGILRMFGAGDPTQTGLNKNYAASIKGYNQTLQSSLEALAEMMAEMQGAADKSGGQLEDQEMFFRYGITSVGRLMMLGKANPQSSKLIREVLLPTWSTLDLSDRSGPHYRAYMLAMAQHIGDLFGIKVHKLKPEAAIAEIEALLHGEKLAPILEALDEWQTNLGTSEAPISMDLVDEIREAFGGELTVGALHGLIDYTRFLQAQATGDTKAFKTAMYLEADGVTDGPINSLVNFSTGRFTREWVDLVNRGGLQISGDPVSLADYISQDTGNSSDLYQLTTEELNKTLNGLWATFEKGSPASQINESLRRMMSQFLPDYSFDVSTGELTLKRGLTKNPLTVTVYGSSARGIAAKITSALLDELYKSLSNGEAIDPLLARDIKLLSTRVVTKSFGEIKIENRSQTTSLATGTGTEFTLTPAMVGNLRDNMKFLFAAPMQQAIEGVMGSAIGTATLVRKATQVQSIHFKYAFLQAISDALGAKDGREGANARDFLSRNELQAIFDKLVKQHPMINTGTQLIFVGGSAQAEGATSDFARDMVEDKRRTAAHFWGPKNSGVSGIPYLVIATGDGQMILNALTGEEAPAGVLPVYDGINMPLDAIRQDGEKINQAVYDGWMRNPIRSLADSFSAFFSATGADGILEDMPEAMRVELERAVGDFGETLDPRGIAARLQLIEQGINAVADSLDARKAVLREVPVSVDHMASAGAPFNNSSTIELPANTDDIVALLNEMYSAKREEIRKKPKVRRVITNPDMAGSMKDLGSLDLTSGARVISGDDLTTKLAGLKIPVAHRSMIRNALASKGSKGWKIVHGTDAEIQKYITQNGLTRPNNEEPVHGYAVPTDQVIYLWTADSETLAHELVHAATFNTVAEFYRMQKVQADRKAAGLPPAEETLRPEVQQALERIEILMDEFINLDPKKLPKEGPARENYDFAVGHIRAVENAGATAEDGKAMMLNEFMAWTLTNPDLREIAEFNSVSNPLGRIAKAAYEALKKFFRLGLIPNVSYDILSNLRFNTQIVMRAPFVSTLDVRSQVGLQQAKAPRYGNNERLAKLELGFTTRILDIGKRTENLRGLSGKNKFLLAHRDMVLVAEKVHSAFVANGFRMTPQQSDLFKTMMVVMGLDRNLDGNALARSQEAYREVLRNLKVEDFMADPDSQDQAMREEANDKYNLLTGNVVKGQDQFKRSTLLPAFLALATVDEDFRGILRKLDVPKVTRKKGETLDETLSNLANESMDRLTRTMSREGLNSPNVSAAIDAMMDHLSQTQTDRESFYEKFVTPVGNGVDKVNDRMVNWTQELSSNAADKLEDLGNNSNSKAVRLAAKAVRPLLGLVNEDIGGAQAQGGLRFLDRTNVWQPVRDLMSEVVGRTKDNAPIYDMIKASRAFIQQTRQIFREKLPATIASKYSRALSGAEWAALHKGLMKTDLLALAKLGNAKIRSILSDGAVLDAEIRRLEAEVVKLDPKASTRILDKGGELAEFMMTGEPSGNLLRNAEAVASLFGELPEPIARRRGLPAPELVEAVDQLTSLYALKRVAQADRDMLAKIATSEVAGLDFTLDYMKGQRADELAKRMTARGRLNHYKGRVGSEPKAGSHLIVSPDSEYAELTKRGYVRVGNYNGSAAEGGRGRHGYYLAPLNGRSRFNQGIMQNVREMVYGVDPVSGFSFGMHNAGRITDQKKVAAITAAGRRNGRGGEPLLPVFDEAGKIVAYERSLDPRQLARLDYETDLSKLLGMWRGRQVEEANAVQLNHELISKLKDIYDARNAGDDDLFVNVLDEDVMAKDPVLADAVKLFTPETLFQIERAFGGKGLMVRKSMINDVTGYRDPSIGDFWTGNTRISEGVAKGAADVATAVFGPKAYEYLVTGEKLWQNFVADARTTIVVRSVVVPVANMMSNVYQLVSRGVPLASITKGIPAKLAEISTYHANHQREIVLDAEMRAAGNDPTRVKAIQAELDSLRDSHRRLSIWPLIQAGEFSSVSEATVMTDESTLFEGKLVGYMEQLADKLPDSVRTAGRYAIISRDTALYQGLQRSVEYGDFLAKAVLFDDLVKRKNMSARDALVRISDEFVNYDRLPGRVRGSLEANGLLWFWHFKLRALKIALSTVRNNPLHALLAAGIPVPDFLGSVGTPVTDNVLAIAAEGKLHYSTGVLQGLHAHSLNPWVNVVS